MEHEQFIRSACDVVSFVRRRAGDYVARAWINYEALPGRLLCRVVPGPLSPAHCVLPAGALPTAVCGARVSSELWARDACTPPRTRVAAGWFGSVGCRGIICRGITRRAHDLSSNSSKNPRCILEVFEVRLNGRLAI